MRIDAIIGVIGNSPHWHIISHKEDERTFRAMCGEMLLMPNLTFEKGKRTLCKNCSLRYSNPRENLEGFIKWLDSEISTRNY